MDYNEELKRCKTRIAFCESLINILTGYMICGMMFPWYIFTKDMNLSTEKVSFGMLTLLVGSVLFVIKGNHRLEKVYLEIREYDD